MHDKARYFPVSPAPLKMVAGLSRLGTDFGQGVRDAAPLQEDRERPRYVAEKRRAPPERHGLFGDDPAARQARDAALSWLRTALHEESPDALAEASADDGARDDLEALARAIQEDFAVLEAGEDGAGRVVALDVRFPSGWRPERLGAASFAAIHAPVPGFATTPEVARSMVRAMVERGPYVRFMWTVCSDDQLDHHPDVRTAPDFEDLARWHLRVERQVMIPLRAARAGLFLIRTYLYAWSELTAAQQATLLGALQVMPEAVRAYKGLPSAACLQRMQGVHAAPARGPAL